MNASGAISKYTQRTGEEIFILDTAERQRPDGLPDEDFWLLDDTKVVRMHYDKEGRFVGGELLPESEAPRYCQYRDMAVAAAVPFDETGPRIRSTGARTG